MIAEKLCKKCGLVKPASEFYAHKQTRDRLQTYCKSCSIADSRENRQANPERVRAGVLRRTYNMTPEDHAALLAAQGGVCAICAGPAGVRAFHVDHDHSCCPGKKSCGQCVRGLLCTACNVGLGYYEKRAHLFVEYLKTHSREATT